jgi:hypothetical protein
VSGANIPPWTGGALALFAFDQHLYVTNARGREWFLGLIRR